MRYGWLFSALVFIVGIAPAAVSVEPDLSGLTIRTEQDAEAQRQRLTQLIFGAPTLPAVRPQSQGDELIYSLPFGYRSIGRLVAPAQPNQELIIYHHGPFTDAQIADIEQGVMNHFLPAGYTILFVSMPLYGPNKDDRFPNPQSHNDFYAQTPNAIRYFLEPIVAFVNELAPKYRRIAMLGLSGGGWSTVMYTALDGRIAKSYPVAGSYPQYVVRQMQMSRDAEQIDPAIYGQIDYLDFYAIAAMRHQLQIYNLNDPCCFFGGYGKQYEAAVAGVVKPFGGSFTVLIDPDNRTHSISEQAFAAIAADLQSEPPANIPPTVDAGVDQHVSPGIKVTLLGAASDRDGTIVRLQWTQTLGPTVQLSDPNKTTTSFVAPGNGGVTLRFALTATDDRGAVNTDTVDIIVDPLPTNAAALPPPANVPASTSQSKSGGCFIATAAYGSAMADDVRYLRAFRDRYLLTNELGRWFVEQYYEWSPTYADWLREHDRLRALVRLGLSPWVALSQWTIDPDRVTAETADLP